MLSTTTSAEKDLHVALLTSRTKNSGGDKTTQKALEKNGPSISVPLVTLQHTQSWQYCLEHSVQASTYDKILETNSPSDNIGSKKILDSLPKLQAIMERLDIYEDELTSYGIDIIALDQAINKNWSGRLLRWFALESLTVKFLQFPFLDERGIQSAEIVPASHGCCHQIVEWGKTRVWSEAISVPFKSETMLRRIYGISNFFASTDKFITRVWSLLLLTFLSNDLYYYYTYPDERYDTTLITIFFTQSKNEQTLSNYLLSNYVWPEVLVLPIVWGLIKAIYARSYVSGFNEENIKSLLAFLNTYQSSFIKDVLFWLSPINKVGNSFEFIQRTLLWDNRLQPGMRLALFTALKSFIRRTNKLTQWNGIAILNTLADSITPNDLMRMQRYGADKKTLLSFLVIKAESIAELQYLASAYRLNEKPEDRCYEHYIKPFMRYLLTHYALWCLGQPRSKLLQPLFWSWKLGKLYVQIKFFYTVIKGITTIIQRYLDKKNCEAQGKLWLYMDQVADYVCSVCGDLPVFYKNIFNIENCIQNYLSQPRSVYQIINILQRAYPSSQITELDLSYQSFFKEDNSLAQILSTVSNRMPLLKSLYFGSWDLHDFEIDPGCFIENCSLSTNSIQAINQFLHNTTIAFLDLSHRQFNSKDTIILFKDLQATNLSQLYLWDSPIGDEGVINLAENLPYSTLEHLSLWRDNIGDDGICKLAQIMPFSNLTFLGLAQNNISDIGLQCIIEKLPYSQLGVLTLEEQNHIYDRGILALSHVLGVSKMTELSLYGNDIVAPSLNQLIQALPNSTINWLSFSSYNFTTEDIKNFALLLPKTQISTLAITHTPLGDEGLSYLASMLTTNSKLTRLQIENAQCGSKGLVELASSLPISSLKFLSLQSNYLESGGEDGVEALALSLPISKLETLDLWNTTLSYYGIKKIASTLANTTLTTLELGYNHIGNDAITVLAQTLPFSQVTTLAIEHNQIGDLGVKNIAEILPDSQLSSLWLESNQVGNSGAEFLANTLIKIPYAQKLLWLQQVSINNNQKRALALGEPNTKLKTLYLNFNNISTQGAISLCYVLPGTDISMDNLGLDFNQGVDKNIVDPKTCMISAATKLEAPFFIRWPYQTMLFFRQQSQGIYSTVSYPFLASIRQEKATITVEEVDGTVEVDTIKLKLATKNSGVNNASCMESTWLDFPAMLLQQAKNSASSFFNVFSHYIDNLIDSARKYATGVATDCPSYFPRNSPYYWRNGGSHTLFFSRITESALNSNNSCLPTHTITPAILGPT